MKQLFVYPTEVKAYIGTTVYFLSEETLIEGKIVGYYSHLVAGDPFSELGESVVPTDIGYIVAYRTPNIEGKQLLADSEIFLTKEELWDNLTRNSFKYETGR
jgi:hypothetical protein